MIKKEPLPVVGAVILTGGESRRMGECKSELVLEGRRFLDRIAGELARYPERLLSVREAESAPACPGFTVVQDQFYNCGAMAGLHAALKACISDHLLAVACDMPLFQAGLGQYLSLFISPSYDVYIPVDRRGQAHPLCGIYSKSALPVLERRLREGDYRLMMALEELRVKHVPLYHSIYSDETVANINTPEEYAALLAAREIHK